MGESDRPSWPHIRKVTEVYHTGWFGMKGRAVLDCQHVIDFDAEHDGPKVGELRNCRFCVQIDGAFKASGLHGGEKFRMAKAELPGESRAVDFFTNDHPAARGRTPRDGEHGFRVWFPLDDGRTLNVHIGDAGFTHLQNVILGYLLDVTANPTKGEEG